MGVFWGRWAFDLFIAVNLALAAGGYLALTRRVSHWQTRWSACWYTGLGLLAVTYLGPIAAWSHTFFWAHMTQHLVVMMAVGPLLVLGAPVTLIFRASSDATRRRWILPILRSRAVRVLTNPYVTWVIFAGVLLGVHFTPFYNAALENHDLDQWVEQPLYLIASVLYYFPLIGANLQPRRPSPAIRMASMALMMIPEALVGAVLYFASQPLYPAFDRPRPFGFDPLADQQLAGALMWALVMTVESGWMMLVAVDWFNDEARRSAREDRCIAEEHSSRHDNAEQGTDEGEHGNEPMPSAGSS